MKAMDLPLDAMPTESPGARKAALVLHGLSPDDRRWLLSHLPAPQRETVGPLLDELVALGVPADAKLMEEVLGSHRTVAALSGQEPFALSQAAASDVARVVAQESAALVATLLNVRSWPWHEALLALLPAPRRQQVDQALSGLRHEQSIGQRIHAPALEAALVHEVAARIAKQSKRMQPASGGELRRAGGWWRVLRGSSA